MDRGSTGCLNDQLDGVLTHESAHDAEGNREESELETECCVCYNSLTQPCITSCKHVFCHGCITRCMRSSRPYSRGRCPVCRGNISLYSVTDISTGIALKQPRVTTVFGSTYTYDGDPSRIALGSFEIGASAQEVYFVVAKAYLAAEYGLVARVRYGGGSGAVGRFLLENVVWDEKTRRLCGMHTWENITVNATGMPQTVWEFDVVFAVGLETTECAHITSHLCYGIDKHGNTGNDKDIESTEPDTETTNNTAQSGIGSHDNTRTDTDTQATHEDTISTGGLVEGTHTHTHPVLSGEGRCSGTCSGRAKATVLHLDHMYRLRDAPATIWGCVYAQFDTIGLASYHFNQPGAGGSYISYEAAPSAWRLDDGNRPPDQKLFLDPVYDPVEKVFTATVEWEAGFNGDAKWEYTIAFADDLRTIVAGSVESYGHDGEITRETLFNRQLFYKLCYDEI